MNERSGGREVARVLRWDGSVGHALSRATLLHRFGILHHVFPMSVFRGVVNTVF